jgi:release factor glutamine methyltransferase
VQASPIDEAAIVAQLRAAGCVFAEDEARLLIDAAATASDLAVMVTRRVEGLPLEHVVGWADFCGLRISVDPGVFVPRPRSELLVREAAAIVAESTGDKVVVVDMCCGSGAIGVALVGADRRVDLHAADIEPAAVRCARRNLDALGQVYEGDLFDPLPSALRGRVDVIVVNAPYVPTDSIAFLPPEARAYEPPVALDGGRDGLDVVRRVVDGAGSWLAARGHLLIETSERQAPTVVELFGKAGLRTRVGSDDELGATVVIGRVSRT